MLRGARCGDKAASRSPAPHEGRRGEEHREAGDQAGPHHAGERPLPGDVPEPSPDDESREQDAETGEVTPSGKIDPVDGREVREHIPHLPASGAPQHVDAARVAGDGDVDEETPRSR